MTTPIQVEATVAPDGQIHVSVPGLAPGQRVHVSIAPQEAQQVEENPLRAIDVINDMPGHLEFKTAEEVDAYLREERESWDR